MLHLLQHLAQMTTAELSTHLAVGLFAIRSGFYSVISVFSNKGFSNSNYPDKPDLNSKFKNSSTLNGVTLGLGGFQMTTANGFVINGTISMSSNVNGVEISGSTNTI